MGEQLDQVNEILAEALGEVRASHATEVLLAESVGRLAAGIAVGGAGGGADGLAGALNPGGFVAITAEKVLVLSHAGVKARPEALVLALDRNGLVAERGSKRLMGVIKLDTLTLSSDDFSATFHIPKNAKTDGLALMAELGL